LNARIRVAFLICLLAGFVSPWLHADAQAVVPVPVTPVDLPVGRSLPLQTAVPITRVSIATPEIADVLVISERELVINSIRSGETDAIVWLNDGTRTHYRISVHSPSDRKQIAIAVKFAEVRKDALRQLGLSGYFRDKNTRVGSGIFNSDNVFDKETGAVTIPSTANFLTILSDFGTDDVLAFLQAEEQRGNARLLAEPNLLAGNKDTASFLAGGELPIPVVQGAGGVGGAQQQLSIQYREFGIRLWFMGEILNDSLIKLSLTPEVSSLDYTNAILLQGFRIPAFRTRRVNTTIDVKTSQSLVVSGLFAGEEERVRTGIPLLKDIPILGALFSSSRFQRNETELLVVVTPVIVNPLNLRPQDMIRLLPDTARPALDAIRKKLPQD
jgi:pilus assembly protein CpaC